LREDAQTWWTSFEFCEWMSLSQEAMETLILDKWYHTKCKDKYNTKGLFSCGKSILQVHGCIHKENVIIYINPSCQQNLINVHLVNRLQVPTKNIHSTQVVDKHVQIFKDLKITMDKYVLHSNFHAIDMDDVDIVLGYPWMDSVGTVNINVQNKFLNIWYKKNKITLQDVSLSKKYGPTEANKEVISESKVESEAESTEGHKTKPCEGHNKETT